MSFSHFLKLKGSYCPLVTRYRKMELRLVIRDKSHPFGQSFHAKSGQLFRFRVSCRRMIPDILFAGRFERQFVKFRTIFVLLFLVDNCDAKWIIKTLQIRVTWLTLKMGFFFYRSTDWTIQLDGRRFFFLIVSGPDNIQWALSLAGRSSLHCSYLQIDNELNGHILKEQPVTPSSVLPVTPAEPEHSLQVVKNSYF